MDGSVRSFSVWKDTKQQHFGRAGTMSGAKIRRYGIDPDRCRLPSVVAIDVGRRQRWDNVLCVHADSPIVTTWNTTKQKLGAHQLLHHRFDSDSKLSSSVALSINVTACGNFALIGYSSGHLDMFNIQSGIHRGSFIDPDCVSGGKKCRKRAHSAAVVGQLRLEYNSIKKVIKCPVFPIVSGVCSDQLNRTTVSASCDGIVKLWHLKSRRLIRSVDLCRSISVVHLHRDHGLLAIGSPSGAIGLVDIQFGRLVRRFDCAHSDSITALTFSNDGKWLLTAAEDGQLKLWDIATWTLIDIIHCESPCISLSFSPTGEFLATCHRGHRAVFLWVNKVVHQSNLLLTPLTFDGQSSSSPTVQPIDKHQLTPLLVTLSGLATPRWAHLPDMDRIRRRNRPVKPAEKPKNAPFFLPTVSTLTGFTFDNSPDKSDANERGRILTAKRQLLEPITDFGRLLLGAENSPIERAQCFVRLKAMGPASIDTELTSLPDETLPIFLHTVADVMEKRTDFELAQAYLASFIRMHRTKLWSPSAELAAVLKRLARLHGESWTKLDTMMLETLGLIQWIKAAAL